MTATQQSVVTKFIEIAKLCDNFSECNIWNRRLFFSLIIKGLR